MEELRNFSYDELGCPAEPGEYRSRFRLAPVFVDAEIFSEWRDTSFAELVRCEKFRLMGDAVGYWLAVGLVGSNV